MTITVDRKELSRALTVAKRTLGKGETFPVPRCVRLDVTREGELVLESTDLEHATRILVKGSTASATDAVEPILVPHNRLAAIVRGMKGSEVELEWQAKEVCTRIGRDCQLRIECGLAKVDVDAEPLESFPDIDWSVFKGDVTVGLDHFTFTTDRLAAMLRETTYAASRDETRYNLGGVFIDSRDERLSFVATDGHRLAIAESEHWRGNGWNGIGQIVPLVAAQALEALVSAKHPIGPTVHAVATGRSVCFRIGTVAIQSKTIDGTYPNYRQAIPESGKATCVVRVSLDTLADAVSTVDTGDKEAPFVLLSFDMDSIVVSSKAGKCIVPTLGNTPDSGPISFNGRYLQQLCASFAGSHVNRYAECRMEWSDSLSAVVFRPDDSSSFAVLMPVRQ